MAAEERQEFVHRDGLLPGAVLTAVGYRSSNAVPRLHRGVPSGALTVIFSLDDPVVTARQVGELGTAAEFRTDILAGGLHTAPAYVWMPRDQSGIQLAVHPLAARALLGATTAELGFPVTDGRDLFGADAERLRLRMIETPDWDARFDLLAGYLRRRIAAAPASARPRPEIGAAWRWLLRSGGTGSVAALARHVALSPRQLNTVLTRELGHGAKGLGRLIRFQRATQQIAQPLRGNGGRPPDLAAIAAECGYYDQSHLVRDFQAFLHISPTGWLAEERRNIQAGGHRNGEG